MRARTLLIVVLVGAMGYSAGRGVVPPRLPWVAQMALTPFAAAPAEGRVGETSDPRPAPNGMPSTITDDLTA
ncbi:MAG TPA: hypothetical protein VLD61_10970, partial [Methylomirabilota bacterium]|nr:hypothetical protein [Methylomirabilota bacterium]